MEYTVFNKYFKYKVLFPYWLYIICIKSVNYLIDNVIGILSILNKM